jgi:D-hexose-6-phosphate mutarotase
VLWHSKDSWFEPGKPIRGGIPVCWPWFGAHPEDPEQPSHDVCTVIDPAQKRSIEIHKENSRSTVVWNPWQEKAARMPDFGKDEFTGMVCVETANCGPDPVTLPPGQAHALHLQIRAQNQLNHPLSPDDYRFSL